MNCPFCGYDFYTLRNAIRYDENILESGQVDPGRIARKLWLNCPACEHDFPAWVHFAYDPENSLAYLPNHEESAPRNLD